MVTEFGVGVVAQEILLPEHRDMDRIWDGIGTRLQQSDRSFCACCVRYGLWGVNVQHTRQIEYSETR